MIALLFYFVKQKFCLFLLLSTLFFIVSGCAAPQRDMGSTNLHVDIYPDKYVPSNWRIPAGQSITLTLHNADSEYHGWTILAKPYTHPWDTVDEQNIYFSQMAEPGVTLTVQFTAPLAPGEYDVVSPDTQDIETGIIGHIVVIYP